MKNNNRTLANPSAQNISKNNLGENRKTSGDNDMKTSENTPKSQRHNIIKIKMDSNITEQKSRSEENRKESSDLLPSAF